MKNNRKNRKLAEIRELNYYRNGDTVKKWEKISNDFMAEYGEGKITQMLSAHTLPLKPKIKKKYTLQAISVRFGLSGDDFIRNQFTVVTSYKPIRK